MLFQLALFEVRSVENLNRWNRIPYAADCMAASERRLESSAQIRTASLFETPVGARLDPPRVLMPGSYHRRVAAQSLNEGV